MTRTYKRKEGPSMLFKYSDQQMNSAVHEVREGTLSIRRAADKHRVPRSTLRSKVNGLNPLSHGRQTALSAQEERTLVEGLTLYGEWGAADGDGAPDGDGDSDGGRSHKPLTVRGILDTVQSYMSWTGRTEKVFKNDRPGREWAASFLRRHPALVARLARRNTRRDMKSKRKGRAEMSEAEAETSARAEPEPEPASRRNSPTQSDLSSGDAVTDAGGDVEEDTITIVKHELDDEYDEDEGRGAVKTEAASPAPAPAPAQSEEDQDEEHEEAEEEDDEEEDDDTCRSRGRRGRRRGSQRKAPPEPDERFGNSGLDFGYSILQQMLNANSTFLNYPEAKRGMFDYHDVIEKPMWLEEINRRFDDNEYLSIVDFVMDVRLLLLNAYIYFGPGDMHTKRALRLEQILENKLTLLPVELRQLCSLEATHGITVSQTEEDAQANGRSGDFHSWLLESVADEKFKREKNRRSALQEEIKIAKTGLNKDIMEWESASLLAPPANTQMKTMWELPQIGLLIQLTSQVLCIDEISQYEIERMFLMPCASKTLAKLMTSLLSPPAQRNKLNASHPPMPYSIWSRKLAQKVAVWYKMYQAKDQNAEKLVQSCGIEKEFWNIMGDWNQLEDYEFHELSFHQRVWLVKTLCDFLVHQHKTMQDAIAGFTERDRNCKVLGEDSSGREYLYFPSFSSVGGLNTFVRVYRRKTATVEHKSPELDDRTPLAVTKVRNGKGNYLPVWMQSRGKGKRSKFPNKKRHSPFHARNFLSRLAYRMPNGMHLGRRKKKGIGKVIQNVATTPRQTVNDSSSPSTLNSETVDSQPCDLDDKIPDVEVNSRRSSRRSQVSQGFYADWSDSDSTTTESPSTTPLKKQIQRVSSTRSAFAGVSDSVKTVDNGSLSPKLSKSDADSDSENSDDSGNKSGRVDMDDSIQDSGCEEGASRNSVWTSQDQNLKSQVAAEDDEDADEDSKEENLDDKKNEKEEAMSEDTFWLERDKGKMRPHYNPHWLLLGTDNFELVADSVQGIRNLIDNICGDDEDMDLNQRLSKQSASSKLVGEEKLEQQLRFLMEEFEPFELKLETNVRLLRTKLYEEWTEFQNRSSDCKDEAESHWRKILLHGLEHSSVIEDVPKKEIFEAQEHKEEIEEDSQTGVEIRHSLRTKKPKVDTKNSWHNYSGSTSEEEESDEELDDVWEMPRRRTKRKLSTGRARKLRKDCKSEEDGDEDDPLKKEGLTSTGDVSSAPTTPSKKSASQPSPKSKPPSKNLPNKLILDKEGNMFITLGCGTKVQLKKDEDGKIMVPEGYDGLSNINGKTLEQLVGTGRVVQNKRQRAKKITAKVPNQSTTLFPAASVADIESASANTGTAFSTIPSKPIDPLVKTYGNKRKNILPRPNNLKPIPQAAVKKQEPEEVVLLSDGSDDSIEVLKETEPKAKSQNRVPQIQSVTGKASVNLLAPKPLTSSVTMMPVVVKKTTNANSQWSPTIANACSLKPASTTTSSRVRSPGAPQLVITPTKAVPARRNLQQTNAYQVPVPTPNQNFVPVSPVPVPVRQPQSQFIPVNQINQLLPTSNQFPAVAQVVSLNSQFIGPSPSYVQANSQFIQPNTQFVVNNPPAFQFVQVPSPQIQLALPLNAQDTGLPPGLTGQIVIANGDNNQFSYAFKLDDGGLIFLSNQQVNKIRAANGGKLTTLVTFQTQ